MVYSCIKVIIAQYRNSVKTLTNEVGGIFNLSHRVLTHYNPIC